QEHRPVAHPQWIALDHPPEGNANLRVVRQRGRLLVARDRRGPVQLLCRCVRHIAAHEPHGVAFPLVPVITVLMVAVALSSTPLTAAGCKIPRPISPAILSILKTVPNVSVPGIC